MSCDVACGVCHVTCGVCHVTCDSPTTAHPQVAEEDLINRVPLRIFTPIICYDISVVKTTILSGLRSSRAFLLQHAAATLHRTCSKALSDSHVKLSWLSQIPLTPHDLHARQKFCDSLDDFLSHHQGFVRSVDVQMALLSTFSSPLDDSSAAAFYESVYLPKRVVQAVAVQLPVRPSPVCRVWHTVFS